MMEEIKPVEPLEWNETIEAVAAIYYNGEVSDESEHLDWRDSPEGNSLGGRHSDRAGQGQRMTEQEIELLYGDPVDGNREVKL